jgi:IMP dehydrogenase
MKIQEAYTYDDVLLIPQKSFIDHRSDVSTKTKLSRHIEMYTPFVSANMDTVTKSDMAIAMAREGGIGIIHRFMTIEEHVQEVQSVKRNVGFVLNSPYTIMPDTKLSKVWALSQKYNVDSFVVVDANKKVVGILCKRDYIFEENKEKEIFSYITPLKNLIYGKANTSVAEAKRIFKSKKIEKLPLIDKEGYLKGLITAKSILNFEKFPYSTKDAYGRYRVGAAVGVVKDYMERAEALIEAGADVLVVDVAHGHNDVALRAVSQLRKKFKNIDLIGGNVATPEGALALIAEGVDAVKVGIGPGGLCTTRMVAGVGYPQFTAVMECSKVAKKKGVPVIADGGTNYPGDISKAIAAGGSCVMLAGWFAGTDESPGALILRKGVKYKVHRGSASFLATADRSMKLDNKSENQLNSIVAEGVEALVPYKGRVSDVIYQLAGALKSGMSYCNAKSIPELWKNAKFVKITDAGFRESKSHNVAEI